jgi:hypothetical protein
MELLRFDSRKPAPRFASLIESLKVQLSTVQVVASHALSAVPAHVETPAAVALPVPGEPLVAAAA